MEKPVTNCREPPGKRKDHYGNFTKKYYLFLIFHIMPAYNHSDEDTINRNEWYVALYRQHYNYLVAIGLNAGYGIETIKDTINQTFLHFIEKKINWSEISNRKHFIAVSFRRRLLNLSAAKENRLVFDLPETDDTEGNAEEKIIVGEEQRLLQEKLKCAFLHLPPRCQLVVKLKYYEGLTTAQITQKTGLSHRSIYNNLSVALKELRNILEKQEKRPVKHLNFLLLSLF